ncbi:MAG: glycohydrolase toxin TNT-related protein [Acetobacteraceae bacterium]|nr:glycohydrolase toxin TNT-related protein [Acetobacteraceae bacterium]
MPAKTRGTAPMFPLPGLLVAASLVLTASAPAFAQGQNPESCAAPARVPTYRPDLSDKWFGCDGQLRWPPRDGFTTPPGSIDETLPPGTEIDRYGSEYGHFFAIAGASCESRALP